MKNSYFIVIALFFASYIATAQTAKKGQQPSKLQKKESFFTIRKNFNNNWKKEHASYQAQSNGENEEGESGYEQFKRWEWYWENRVNPVTGAFPNTRASDIFQQRALSGGTNRSASGNWSSLGPSTSPGGDHGLGRLNCIGFREGDNNTYYVGSPSGGLWKTIDDGATWTVLTDDNPVLGVSDVVVLKGNSPSSDTLYIATGDRDEGSLWTFESGLENDNNSIGVLKSTDGGTNWSSTGLSYNASEGKIIYRLIISPDNHNILFAATTDGLYKSTDKGTTWSLLTSLVFYDLEFKPGDAQTIYAGTNRNGSIYVSNNGGNTWSQTFVFGAGRVALAVTPSQADWVYAIMSSGYFYKSENSGQSFDVISPNMYLLGADCDGGGYWQPFYDLAIAADPNNAYNVYVGGINTWKTTDGGNSWSITNHWSGTCGGVVQEVHADKHRLAFQNGSSTLFECNDGGLYKTIDGGQTWNYKGNGIVTSQIYRFDVSQTVAGDVIAGLQDNGTKSVNSGTWEDVIGADGMDCIIDYTNNNIQYGEWQLGDLFKTNDHWVTKSQICWHEKRLPYESNQWLVPIAIDPVDHNTIYYSNKGFSVSHDGGATWNTPGYNYNEFAVAPSNNNYIYGIFRGPYSRIYKSTDGGATRTDITGYLPVRHANLTYVMVKHNDENRVWVTMGQFNNYSVFETTDGGTTWNDISYGLPPAPVMCIVQNRQNTSVEELYAGTDVGVYVKYGTSPWELFSNGLPNVVITELKIFYDDNNPSNSRLRAATYGRGVWESDLYTYSAGSPVADFLADDTVPILNQTVLLSDFSSKLPTSWQWTITPSTYTFVDGTNANDQNPHVQFNSAGDYTIQLTVSNSYGSDSKTRTNYVTAGLYHNYCAASGGSGGAYISGVEVGDISNTGTSSDGYHDYKTFSTNLYQGQAENPITITIEGDYSRRDLCIWVDWNRDGNFYGDNENIICENDNNGSGTYYFDVPLNADTGLTVMRVWTKEFESGCGEPCGTSTYGEVEDYSINVTQMPACPPPSYQDEENILSTSVDLTWSQIGSVNSWDVRLVNAGTDTTGLPYYTLTSKPLTIDTLTINTTYDWYVRASCGSTWIGPHTFTTSCSSTTQPFSENFDGVSTPDLPNCWSKLEANGNGYTYVQTDDYSPYSSPNAIRFYNSNDSAAVEMLITPQFTDIPLQQNQVRFFAKGSNGTEQLIVGTLTRPDSLPTFTPFKTIPLTTTYTEYTVMFGATYSKNDTYIGLKMATGDYYQSIFIDDFVYESMPGCPPPSDLSEKDVTNQGATLYWTENGQATSWDIRIVPENADTTGLAYSTVTNDTITVDTLSANTAYDWYVKESCGSTWSDKSTFTTDCNTYQVTLTEAFDGVTTPELPECWSSIVNSSYYYSSVETYQYDSPHSSPNHVRLSAGNSTDDVVMLITPSLDDLTTQQNQIRFFAKSSSAGEQLVVGTMTNPADTATFTPFSTINLTQTYSEYTVMFGSTYNKADTYIALKHGVQVYDNYIYVDDFVYEPMPACPLPTQLTETNIQQTEATLSWDENGSAENWDVRVVLKDSDTTGTAFTTHSEQIIIIDTLSENTRYDWYVRASCHSTWAKSTFVTACGTYDAPFSENFDAETTPEIPHCWSSIVDSYSDYAKVETLSSQFPNSSPNHVVLYNYNDDNANLLLITPEITDLSTQLNQIQFYAKASEDGDSVIVGTMSDPADASTFTAFKTISLTSDYEQYLIMFGTTFTLSDSYIAFKHGLGGSYRYIYIDDFQYEAMPAVPPPSDLYEDTITQNSVYLGWTENGIATQWDVRVVTEWADTTGVPYAITNNNPYNVDTLTDNTSYEWYVKAHNGDQWAGPSYFVTDCGAFTAPYTEDFDDVTAPEIPHCWNTIISTSAQGATIETNISGEHSYPNHVMMYNNGYNSADLILVSPQFSDLTTQQNQIRFYAKGQSPDYTLIVGTMSDPGDASTFSGYDTITLTNTYEEYSIYFGAVYTGTDEYIAFKHGLGGTYRRIYLDDIVYEPMPACPHPSALTTENITQNSATMSWIENGNATSWDVRIVEQGGDTAGAPYATTSNNPYTVDTLSSATYYDWYVRGSCGGDWAGPVNFLTDCGSYTTTLSENFDGVTVPELPICWSAINNSVYPTHTKAETYTSTPNSSPNCFFLFNYYDNNAKLFLVSPQLSDLTSQQNKMTFYAKGNANGYSLIVGTMSNPADESTFIPYQTINLTNTYVRYKVYFGGGYTGTDEYVAFKHGLGGTYRQIYLDDIVYEPITECLQPINQTAENIGGTTERLEWTEQGVGTSWDIRLVLTGTDTTGLPYTTITSNTLMVDTLTPTTNYSWYVRSSCGSTWAGPHNFTTSAANISSFPYAEGFETSVPPPNWTSEVVVNGNPSPIWSKFSNSNYPLATAIKGNYMATFNSASASAGSMGRLITPAFNFSGLSDVGLTFWFFHYHQNGGTGTEGIHVQVSVNGDPWTDVKPFIQRQAANSGWSKYTTHMSDYAGENNVKISFLANSNQVLNMYLDSVTIHGSIPATSTWNGSSDTSWYESNNWSSTDIPFDSTDVVIPSGLTYYPDISTPGAICRNLIIESDASGDGAVKGSENIIVSNSATVKRFLTSGKWHEVSTMVDNSTVNSFYLNNAPRVWMNEYDESTDTRTPIISLSTPMVIGNGYEAWVENGYDTVASYHGVIHSANVAVSLSYTHDTLGYNLLGNPYSCPIQFEKGNWNFTNCDEVVWVWDPVIGNYRSATSTGGTLANKIIPMGQAFFVHANNSAASLTIPAEARIISNQPFYKTEVEFSEDSDVRHFILSVRKEEKADFIWFGFDKAFTEHYDRNFDARKMAGDPKSPQMYAIDGDQKYMVDALPLLNDGNTLVRPLFFEAGEAGEYKITASETAYLKDVDVVMEDKKTNTLQLLNKNNTYDFYSAEGAFPDRFVLHFNYHYTGINSSKKPEIISIYAYNKNIYISSHGKWASMNKNLKLFDITGRVLLNKKLNASSLNRVAVPLNNSIVIVRIISADLVVTKKVFIK